MKKILVFALALVLVFGLVACGGGDEQSKEATDVSENGGKTSDSNTDVSENGGKSSGDETGELQGLDGMMKFLETGDKQYFDPASLTEAQKDVLRREVAAEGGSIDFAADGTITFTDKDNSVMTIKPDGTVEFVEIDESGDTHHYSTGKTWPEDGYAALVPKPDFEFSGCAQDDQSFTVLFEGVDYDAFKAYVEQVKAAGFTVDVTENDLPDLGVYTLFARNRGRASVNMAYYNNEGKSRATLEVAYFATEENED